MSKKKYKPKLIPNDVVFADIINKPGYEERLAANMAYFRMLQDLHRARKEKKLTQKQLSELSGVPQETISRIESGERDPQLQTIIKLANSIGKVLHIELR